MVFIKRIIASIIDWYVGWGIFNLLFYYGPGVDYDLAVNPSVEIFKAPGFWMAFFFPILWVIFKDCIFNGVSLGKLICGVRVVDKDTRKKANFPVLIKRNLYLLLFSVELILLFVNKGIRLGDKTTNTEVILKKEVKQI